MNGQLHSTRLSVVLSAMDRKTHFLEAVRSERNQVICRMISKKEAYESAKRRRKEGGTSLVEKECLLYWQSSAQDVEHKLRRQCDWLKRGARVTVTILHRKKKKGEQEARVSRETEDALLRQIEETFKDAGAKEFTPLKSTQSNVTWVWEGKKEAAT